MQEGWKLIEKCSMSFFNGSSILGLFYLQTKEEGWL